MANFIKSSTPNRANSLPLAVGFGEGGQLPENNCFFVIFCIAHSNWAMDDGVEPTRLFKCVHLRRVELFFGWRATNKVFRTRLIFFFKNVERSLAPRTPLAFLGFNEEELCRKGCNQVHFSYRFAFATMDHFLQFFCSLLWRKKPPELLLHDVISFVGKIRFLIASWLIVVFLKSTVEAWNFP